MCGFGRKLKFTALCPKPILEILRKPGKPEPNKKQVKTSILLPLNECSFSIELC